MAVPSAVERKELLQFPVVKEVPTYYLVYFINSTIYSLLNTLSTLISLQKVSSLQSQLLGHAQQLNRELEGDDQRLSEINHALEQALKERVSARNKRLHTRQEADGAYVRVKVLLERRKEAERQLQFRKRELRFLQQLQEQQREREEEEWEREELKAVLMNKDAEVRQLQDQLREVEGQLGCAREEARNMREELQRVTVELADKSAQVRQLEWTKSMLEICLKSGNTKVEMVLIQSSAATGSKEALHKEIKVLERNYIQLFNCILTFQSHALVYSMASSKVHSCIVTHADSVLVV